MTKLELREKDLAVLQAIHDGASAVSEIKEATTLTNREINYSLTEKGLEQNGFVDIQRPDGREWQKINGEEKYIWKPKQVNLTDRGLKKIAEHGAENPAYQEMSKQELIQRVNDLENRINRLETVFKDFRSKVMDQL